MKKRYVLLLLSLVLLVGFSPAVFAAKKKTVWVLTSATTAADSDNPTKRIFQYNKRGLFSSITEKNGRSDPFTTKYTYNKKNRLVEAVKYQAGSPKDVISTETYTYAGGKAVKSVQTWPNSDFIYTRKYTWKNNGKKIIMKESFDAEETLSETVTIYFDKNRRITKSVCKYAGGGGFTMWYKYDKNGRFAKAYSDSSGKKTATIKYKYKENKNGCVTRITLTNPVTGNVMSVGKYSFKKIKVPASASEQVSLQQRSITGWTAEYLELLN